MTKRNISRLTIIADDELITEIQSYASCNSDVLGIESRRQNEDPGRLGFDLSSVVAVVALIENIDKFAMWFRKILFDSKRVRKSEKLILQTAFKTLEIPVAEPLSVEDIKQILRDAQNLPQEI